MLALVIMEDFLDFDMDRAEAMFRVNVLGLMYAILNIITTTKMKTSRCDNIASMAGKYIHLNSIGLFCN